MNYLGSTSLYSAGGCYWVYGDYGVPVKDIKKKKKKKLKCSFIDGKL